MLTTLLSQGYPKPKLLATLKKFYGIHHDLVNPYNVAVSKIIFISAIYKDHVQMFQMIFQHRTKNQDIIKVSNSKIMKTLHNHRHQLLENRRGIRKTERLHTELKQTSPFLVRLIHQNLQIPTFQVKGSKMFCLS